MPGGDGGRAGFQYRYHTVVDTGYGGVVDRVGDGAFGVGTAGPQVEGRVAVALLSDGGNGDLCRRGSNREGTFYVGEGIVVAHAAAHGNVVRAHGRSGRCCAGSGGFAGEVVFVVAVDKSFIAQTKGRIFRAEGAGGVKGGYSECGLVDHQLGGCRAFAIVGRGGLSGGDGGRAGFQQCNLSVADAGYGGVGHGVGNGAFAVGAAGLQGKGRVAVGLLADGGDGNQCRCGGYGERAFYIDKGVVVARAAAHGNVVCTHGRGGSCLAGGGGLLGEVGLTLTVNKTFVGECEGRILRAEGAGGVVGRDGKGCFVDGEFHGLTAGRVVFRGLLRDGQSG